MIKCTENNILKDFYNYMELQVYPIDAIFIFVYNDYNSYVDDPHLEECFDKEEVHEILDSICDLFQEYLYFGSEDSFIKWCASQKTFNKNIYVYTMAQYIEGFSRRTLVPAVCQYYGFININADAYMSAIGCNKEIMYRLLIANGLEDFLAPTIFLNRNSTIDYTAIRFKLGEHIVVKPICESCCIDMKVLEKYTKEELYNQTKLLINKYGHAMIQKYIEGDEIGITVFCHSQEMFALSPIQMVFPYGKTYLTHKDSFYNNYKLINCNVPSELLDASKRMSYSLGFYCTARYDFRFDGKNYYLFDLSPNPTVNGYTSSNYAVRSTLGCDHRGILRLMVYEKIASLEPSFNRTQ